MKHFYIKICLFSILLTFAFVEVSGQTIIWSEDFSSYSGYTGIDGGSYPYRNLGDYPGGVTKWTLNVNNCTLSNDNDYVQLVNDERLNFHDVDGKAYWTTESINISSYTNIGISIDLTEQGNMDDADFILCQYRIDGGSWVRIVRKKNNFTSANALKTGLSGNTLQIRVVVKNDENSKYHRIDNVIVTGELTSSVVLSSASNSILEGGGSTTLTATVASKQSAKVTVNLDFSGTASTSDYTVSNSQIVIPVNSLSASVTLFSVNDTDVEGDEIVTVDIGSVINGIESGDQQVDITIVDDDIASTEQILIDAQSPEVNYSPTQLVQKVLVTGCLTADDITYSGDALNGIGFFSAGASDFPLKSGIILSTGNVANAPGPSSGFGGDDLMYDAYDPDIITLVGPYGSQDAQVLEFDFVPAGDKLEFRYVFASEEYPGYACDVYNDVFGFIISGFGIDADPGLSGKNIAIIPGTSDKVSIHNVYNPPCFGHPDNSAYYVDESGGSSIIFNGRTVVLKAEADVKACETYHIRLIISDVYDNNYNSAVFLEAESFKTNEVVITNGLGSNDDLEIMYEGCDNSFLKFTREDNLSEDFTFDITISGSADNGTDFVQTNSSGAELGAFPLQITIPANETEVIYYYKAISDALIEGDEFFQISFSKSCPCSSDPTYYKKKVTIIDVPEIEATTPSNVQCMSGIPVATITVELKALLDPKNYEYSLDGSAYQSSNVFTINDPVVGSKHTVSVQDKFSCNDPSEFTVTIPEVVPIEANAGEDKEICEGEAVQLVASGGIFYEWSCSPSSGLTYLNNIHISNPTVDENIPFGDYIYRLTVQESSSALASCVSKDSMTLKVKENSHFTIVSNQGEYCSRETINLSSTISNTQDGDKYLWTGGVDSPTSANTSAVFQTLSLVSKDFTLTVTKSNGCKNTEDISGVFIFPEPLISLIDASSNLCTDGSNGEIHVEATGGTLGPDDSFIYSWDVSGIGNSSSVTGLAADDYTVTVTDSKSCNASKTFRVTAQPKPIGIFFK